MTSQTLKPDKTPPLGGELLSQSHANTQVKSLGINIARPGENFTLLDSGIYEC